MKTYKGSDGKQHVLPPLDESDIWTAELIAHCACGKPARGTCYEVNAKPPMQPCLIPICAADCKSHRHQPNTMGYMTLTITGHYSGFEPDESGLLEALRCWGRHWFWSNQRKAQHEWDQVRSSMPPPAPLPAFYFRVGRQMFRALSGEAHVHEQVKEGP